MRRVPTRTGIDLAAIAMSAAAAAIATEILGAMAGVTNIVAMRVAMSAGRGTAASRAEVVKNSRRLASNSSNRSHSVATNAAGAATGDRQRVPVGAANGARGRRLSSAHSSSTRNPTGRRANHVNLVTRGSHVNPGNSASRARHASRPSPASRSVPQQSCRSPQWRTTSAPSKAQALRPKASSRRTRIGPTVSGANAVGVVRVAEVAGVAVAAATVAVKASVPLEARQAR